MDDGELLTEDVDDIEACAEICSRDKSYTGGEFDVENNNCFCYKELICLEPCVDLNDGAVEFAMRPLSDFDTCPQSFCEYFAEDEDHKEFCADPETKWIPAKCEAKLNALGGITFPFDESLSSYGYDHSWSSAKGWFFYPPGAEGEDNVVSLKVSSLTFCAQICNSEGSAGGKYELDTNQCHCYENVYCLEPCVGLLDNSVEFATRPRSDFEMCEKSFCNYYSEDNTDFCSDPKVKWNPEGCEKKLSGLTTPDVSGEPSLSPVTTEPSQGAMTTETTKVPKISGKPMGASTGSPIITPPSLKPTEATLPPVTMQPSKISGKPIDASTGSPIITPPTLEPTDTTLSPVTMQPSKPPVTVTGATPLEGDPVSGGVQTRLEELLCALTAVMLLELLL